MKKIVILSSFFLIVLLQVEVNARQPQPLPNPEATDPPKGTLEKLLFNNHFRIGGVEGGGSTSGYVVGLPVIWAEDQIKIVPMAGWFWDTLPGWSGRDAVGGKILYYFQKQREAAPGKPNMYAGMSSLVESGGKDHQTGLTAGVEPFFNRYLKLGFELQIGLRSKEGADRVYGSAGVVVGFGW